MEKRPKPSSFKFRSQKDKDDDVREHNEVKDDTLKRGSVSNSSRHSPRRTSLLDSRPVEAVSPLPLRKSSEPTAVTPVHEAIIGKYDRLSTPRMADLKEPQRAIILYAHHPRDPYELSVNKDEEILVLSIEGDRVLAERMENGVKHDGWLPLDCTSLSLGF
jgi:hypothetical protein